MSTRFLETNFSSSEDGSFSATPSEETGRPNKSKLRREALALTKLGQQLVELSPEALQKLPISDALREAIELAHKIRRNSSGFKRQIQFIGKLIRQNNPDALIQALQEQAQQHNLQQQQFHRLEQWRDRLIEEGDPAIQLFVQQFPHAERQPLRQLVRQAQKQQALEQAPAAKRELFKYLRASAEASGS